MDSTIHKLINNKPMTNHVHHSKLIPGIGYKVLLRAWTHAGWNNPHTTTELGIFMKHRHDIPDWAGTVLEFQHPAAAAPIILRAREIHAFVPSTDYSAQMAEAERRMNTQINGLSLKEELIIYCWKPENISPI